MRRIVEYGIWVVLRLGVAFRFWWRLLDTAVLSRLSWVKLLGCPCYYDMDCLLINRFSLDACRLLFFWVERHC